MEKRMVRQIVLQVFRERCVKIQNTHYQQDIWLEIFKRVFGEEPKSLEDKRFDYLFWIKEGYQALRFVRLYERLSRS